MIKGSIQEEGITIVNIYAPHIGAPKYIKQVLTDIKGETEELLGEEKKKRTFQASTFPLEDSLFSEEVAQCFYLVAGLHP